MLKRAQNKFDSSDKTFLLQICFESYTIDVTWWREFWAWAIFFASVLFPSFILFLTLLFGLDRHNVLSCMAGRILYDVIAYSTYLFKHQYCAFLLKERELQFVSSIWRVDPVSFFEESKLPIVRLGTWANYLIEIFIVENSGNQLVFSSWTK